MAVLALLLGMAGPARAAPLRILVLGDSLAAGYGLAEPDSFPAQLAAALAAQGVEAKVINGGVSGDTSAGGLARLDWVLADDPQLVILELGANDGLRGLDPKATGANLEAIVARLVAEKRAVLLAGMKAPPNLGADYGAAFDGLYPAIAARHGIALYPFFLDGVVTDPALNQDDGIHPNAAGVKVIVQGILPYVVKAIDALPHTAAGG
ncbi:MAG TPA: arylesterase [Dongiaceae bacterium]|jgi:acyl-CoA thioesterase I|nr:arylesterase [Dongiaceae bacterium]